MDGALDEQGAGAGIDLSCRTFPRQVCLHGNASDSATDKMNPWQKWDESSLWSEPSWKQNWGNLDSRSLLPINMNFSLLHFLWLIYSLFLIISFTTFFLFIDLPLLQSCRRSDRLSDFQCRQFEHKKMLTHKWRKSPWPLHKFYTILHETFISSIFI